MPKSFGGAHGQSDRAALQPCSPPAGSVRHASKRIIAEVWRENLVRILALLSGICTVVLDTQYKTPFHHTIPNGPGTNSNQLRISWSDTSFSPTVTFEREIISDYDRLFGSRLSHREN